MNRSRARSFILRTVFRYRSHFSSEFFAENIPIESFNSFISSLKFLESIGEKPEYAIRGFTNAAGDFTLTPDAQTVSFNVIKVPLSDTTKHKGD